MTMARQHRRPRLVRLVPALGSPVWLPRAAALRQLAREDALYLCMQQVGVQLTQPRIKEA